MNIKAKTFVYPAGVPAGWELAAEDAVIHPANGTMGALIRCTATGNYAIHCGASNTACPQKWAQAIVDNKNGNKLVYFRNIKGLSQTQVAEATGILLRSLQKLESGERSVEKMQLSTAIAIAKALDVKAEDLL